MNNEINKGWNVGDIVEIEKPEQYEGSVELLEKVDPPKGSGKPPKEIQKFVKRVEKQVKKVFKGKKVKK